MELTLKHCAKSSMEHAPEYYSCDVYQSSTNVFYRPNEVNVPDPHKG